MTVERIDAAVQSVLGFTLSFFDIFAELGIVLILSLYWAVDRARFERLWLSALPVPSRATARDVWISVESGVGAYLRSEVLQSFLAGWMLGVGYWMLGLPYPVMLAVFGALAWMIPWIGGLIALAAVVVLGWSAGAGPIVLASAYTVAVFVFLEKLVEPRLLDRVSSARSQRSSSSWHSYPSTDYSVSWWRRRSPPPPRSLPPSGPPASAVRPSFTCAGADFDRLTTRLDDLRSRSACSTVRLRPPRQPRRPIGRLIALARTIAGRKGQRTLDFGALPEIKPFPAAHPDRSLRLLVASWVRAGPAPPVTGWLLRKDVASDTRRRRRGSLSRPVPGAGSDEDVRSMMD
jgi:hypothetical protein